MKTSLTELQRAIKGTVVMSKELDNMYQVVAVTFRGSTRKSKCEMVLEGKQHYY